MRLIEASSLAEALERARSLGPSLEHEYAVGDRDTARWEFVGVSDVYELLTSPFETGLEVFSRFLTEPEARSLLEPLPE